HGITFGLWYVSSVAVCRERGSDIPTAAQGLFIGASSAGSALGMSVAGDLLSAGGGARLDGGAGLGAAGAAPGAWSFARTAARETGRRTRVGVDAIARGTRLMG